MLLSDVPGIVSCTPS